MGRVCYRLFRIYHHAIWCLPFLSCILLFIGFHLLEIGFPGIYAVGWVFFFTYAFLIAGARKRVRSDMRSWFSH